MPAGPPCTVGLSDSAAFLTEWEQITRSPRGAVLDFDCRACSAQTKIGLHATPTYGEPPYDIERLYAADATGRQKLVDELIEPSRGALCSAEEARLVDARMIDGRKFAGIFSTVCGTPRRHRRSYFAGTPRCIQSVEVSWWGEKAPDNATEAIIERAFGHVVFSR